MIIFLDENDAEYGALATIKATNAVNGERSITGEIISGDVVLSRIERGWRLRFEDEYYVVTYAKPIDEGKNVQVSFDAVHQFFWDFGKSSVYDQLSDGSHTFRAYLDFIFKNSGYSYTVDTALNVYAFEKQSFGLKKRLTLFNDIITSTGVEFQVNGKVVRILAKVGTDLSTVVRKNFNLNELGIEKNIGDFVTYQKGYGAYFDEEDHSKGRLEVEYISPLASVYGKLEAEPFVDERYSQSGSLLAVLKANVDNSYTISVSLDMEDLTRAGYKYKQPVAGDYIMAINETLGFKEKIRIVSFTSEYDVAGQLIKHTVTCNDIGSVKKLSASYTQTQHQAANAEVNANTAYEFANKALVSANGKNTNYYGDTFPVDNPKGTLKKGDLLFLTVGDTVKQYYWNGAEWVTNPVVSDVEAFKEQIAEELKDVPNREEFENKISEELANSKAEIETQIETAKTQAESNAKEYADTINQETAKVAELANAAAGEIKADLVNVKNDLTATSLVANNAQAAVDAAKRDLANVTSELNTAKQDLTSHAQQLQTQANAQSELTKRVSSVEETANGTKTTVSELTKTVAQNGKDITSVTARTKVVEDDLTSTKTTLSQVKTTADSASQKTATLEAGLNGLSAKFDSLSVGNKNYLPTSRVVNRGCSNFSYNNTTKSWTMTVPANSSGFGNGITFNTGGLSILLNGGETLFFGLMIKANKACSFNYDVNNALSGTTSNDNDDTSKRAHSPSNTSIPANVWTRVWFSYTAKANVPITENNSNFGIVNNTEQITIEIKEVMVAKSNVPVDYQPPDADLEQKIAEYKQTADQNYASLQTTVQNLDGTVKQNKSEFDQTASQIKSSISAVEGKIPTEIGAVNLLKNSKAFKGSNIGGSGTILSETYQSCAVRHLKVTGEVDVAEFYNSVYPKLGGKYVASFWAKGNGSLIVFFHGNSGYLRVAEGLSSEGNVTTWGDGLITFNLTADWKRYWVKYKMKSEPASATSVGKHLLFRTPPNGLENEVYLAGAQLEEGDVVSGYEPSPEDTASQISSLSSEFKQTTDSIKASVTSLNNSTVKSSSLTINADGIVMKAGKSTTDVANAIGSYFAVNQNAINLFSDKINVKGSMIVSGAITSDKIASQQINTAHLNGKIITADVISSNAVTADAIKAGAVTTDKMSANSINGDRITAGTLDAAKIKAGSITASQIASGTITSNQIKAGGISAANIATGAITANKIAAGAIDASKIAANAITANMITGGKLNSTNGATVFDLNAGTLTFNNNYGYIQRVASDKVFEITTFMGTTSDSRDYLTSDFKVRKSDNSRRAGIKFTLYNTLNDKPTAEANINADALVLYDSQYTRLFEVWGKSTYMSNFNFRDWGDVPVAQIHGGFLAQDVGLRGHTESLKTIVERLCKKAGVMWL